MECLMQKALRSCRYILVLTQRREVKNTKDAKENDVNSYDP